MIVGIINDNFIPDYLNSKKKKKTPCMYMCIYIEFKMRGFELYVL